jgi:hypothetical protein
LTVYIPYVYKDHRDWQVNLMNIQNRTWIGLLCTLTLFFASAAARAQVETGTIAGTVRDNTGALVPKAKVVILNEDTGINRTLETDGGGRYSAPGLNVGKYRVTTQFEGFQTEIRTGIVLTVAREALVDFALTIGAVSQQVEVVGEAPLVETSSASVGSLVEGRTIRELPLNGRSYDQLALIQPGVNLVSPGPQAAIPFTFGSGKHFSVGGQLPNANLFLLDATDVNDQGNGTPGGAAGTNLGVDTIQEFKIFTNSFKAEFGHSSGSVITAVTRSGTNKFHGTAFEYIRNSVFDAMNYFDTGTRTPPFRRNQFGGVIGGPIQKDKTFFFAGYEGLRQGQETTQTAIVPTALARQGMLPCSPPSPTCVNGIMTITVNPVVVPYLNLFPLPNGTDFGTGVGAFLSAPNVITNQDDVMGRVDRQLTAKHSVFARYSFDQDSVNAPESLPDKLQVTHSRRQYVTLQLNSILGAKTLNNFRFAFNRSDSTLNEGVVGPVPTTFIPGQTALGGIALGVVGGNSTSTLTPLGANNGTGASLFAFDIFEEGDDFSHIIGKHTLKVGADVQRLQDNTLFNQELLGNYTFTAFTNFLAGQAATFVAGSPLGVPGYWGLRQVLSGVYGQDDYQVSSRLTLNLGLRWEGPTDPNDVNGKMAILPSPAATATVVSDRFFSIRKKNLEPRLGVAWQIDAVGRTVLRAGGGIYHNQILPWAFSQQARTPPFFGLYSLTNPPFPNAAVLLQSPAPGTVSLNMMAPVNKTPTAYQYNLSVQQQIGKNTVAQIAYTGTRSTEIFISRELDTPIPVICEASLSNCPSGIPDGTKYFSATAVRRNTAWAGEKTISAGGSSIYNGVTPSLRVQSPNGLVGQIFYTYSSALDEGTNVSGSESSRSPSGVNDPENLRRDWSKSDFNVTSSLGANFTYPLPFHLKSEVLNSVIHAWTLNGIFTAEGGEPFTVLDSGNQSRNKATNGLSDRPNLNSGFSNNPTHGTSAGCSGFAAGTPVRNASHWFDPCAFSLETAGTYGNLGRNTVIGPRLISLDVGAERNFKIREWATGTFRAEAFNVLNHPNFGLPTVNAVGTTGAAVPTAGLITYTLTSSRQIQFALRINF